MWEKQSLRVRDAMQGDSENILGARDAVMAGMRVRGAKPWSKGCMQGDS